MQEVDALLSENEMLQGKLHSQEEDFRLQNSTLMTELSKVRLSTSPPVGVGPELQNSSAERRSFLCGSQPITLIGLFYFQLCTQIEQLEQENKGLKDGGEASASSPTPKPASSSVDGELLRLQAENSTLQKKMKGVLLCSERAGGGLFCVLCDVVV